MKKLGHAVKSIDAAINPLYEAMYMAYHRRDENEEIDLEAIRRTQTEFLALADSFPADSEFRRRALYVVHVKLEPGLWRRNVIGPGTVSKARLRCL